MKIQVAGISEEERAFAFSAEAAWWEERGADPGLREALGEAVSLGVTATELGASIYLEGGLEGELSLTCSRCLERYRHEFLDRFRLVLEPAGDRVPADPEGANQLARNGLYVSEELEYGWFQGGELTLDDFFAELVALTVPVQPVCRDNCRGLCPRCGVNRNEISCECEKGSANHPFTALAGLREKLARNED